MKPVYIMKLKLAMIIELAFINRCTFTTVVKVHLLVKLEEFIIIGTSEELPLFNNGIFLMAGRFELKENAPVRVPGTQVGYPL